MVRFELTADQKKKIKQTTFPQYTGRKIRGEAVDSVYLSNTNWDGGSRSHYAAINLSTNEVLRLDFTSIPPWLNKVEGSRVKVPEGVAIVEHSICCGKDCGLTVYVAAQAELN